MSLLKIFVPAAFLVAIAVTVVFSSMAASSTSAYAGAGNFGIERPIPYYMLRWDNPILPQSPVAPIFGQ